jgi:hypothetical protein
MEEIVVVMSIEEKKRMMEKENLMIMKYEEMFDICVWLMGKFDEWYRVREKYEDKRFMWIDEYEIVKMFGRIRDKEWRMIMREMDMNGLVLKSVWSKEKGNSRLCVCIGKKEVE